MVLYTNKTNVKNLNKYDETLIKYMYIIQNVLLLTNSITVSEYDNTKNNSQTSDYNAGSAT